MRRAPLLLLVLLLPALAGGAPPAGAPPAAPPWDNAWKGEVRVDATVAVPPGCTLAILPGTTVLLSPGASIDVAGGKLVAEGTEGAPVRFLPASPGSRWGGIRLHDAAEGSRLVRCVLEEAGEVAMEGCSVPVRACLFARGRIGLLLSSGASPVVEGNEFREMEEGGILCESLARPDVSGNRFARCAGWGLYSRNDSRPRIRGNDFVRCGEGVHLKGSLDHPVEGNRFTGNSYAVGLEEAPPGTRVWGNRVEGNGTGIICTQFSSPELRGNRILGNGKGVMAVRSSSPRIVRNEISGNGDGLFAQGLSAPKVEGNDFRDNGRAVVLDASAYAVLRGNNFDGAGVRVELLEMMSADWEHRVRDKPVRGALARLAERRGKAPGDAEPLPPQPFSDPAEALDGTVDARGNWWGEAATAEMERLGEEGNVSSLLDGRDVPVRRYDGFEGEYLQDRVDFSGWAKGRIEGTGVPPGPGGGAP